MRLGRRTAVARLVAVARVARVLVVALLVPPGVVPVLWLVQAAPVA